MVVRVAWRNGRWLTESGARFDFITTFKAAPDGLIDQLVLLHRKGASPLRLRLIAMRLAPPGGRNRSAQGAPRVAKERLHNL